MDADVCYPTGFLADLVCLPTTLYLNSGIVSLLRLRWIKGVYAYLGVTCHLHFWQNDWGLLRATAVTRGMERTPNKSQHRKLTLEKKILPPFLPGFELATFRSQVRRSNQQAIPGVDIYHSYGFLADLVVFRTTLHAMV